MPVTNIYFASATPHAKCKNTKQLAHKMQSMCDPMKAVHLVYDEEDLWNE